MNITIKDITSENFKKYGSVVTFPQQEPAAADKSFKFWSDIAHYSIDSETEIGLCTVFQQPETVIDGMERHLRTPEILIPIDAPFVLPLLLDDENETNVQAFQVDIGEAVVIDPAVWHGACIPVGKKESSYFVIFRRGTPFQDIEKRSVKPINIDIHGGNHG